jgi:protoheme IX farnesyltransferase
LFVYTIWLKRTTEHNTVIGGIAGALPPVMGIAAVNNDLGATALVLFVVLFIWQPPHFWALALIRAEEYRMAGIPMLPVVKGPENTKKQMLYYTVALVPASTLPWVFGICGDVYLWSTLALGAVYLGWTISFVRRPFNPIESRRLFLFSIFYITAVYSLMFVDCQITPSHIASELSP